MSTVDAQSVDERLKEEKLVTKLLKRPELGAMAGVILVTIFFLITADDAMFTLSNSIGTSQSRARSPSARLTVSAFARPRALRAVKAGTSASASMGKPALGRKNRAVTTGTECSSPSPAATSQIRQ